MADSKDERCVLCLDDKRSPVGIPCGHSFCFECLDVYKSYQKYDWAKKCPICRSSLKEKKRAVKRKYPSSNDTTENAVTTNPQHNTVGPSATVTSLTVQHSAAIEQSDILEEFMALAAADSVELTTDDEDAIPLFVEDSPDEETAQEHYESDDDDDSFSYYPDSDSDESFFYFEEDAVSYDHQSSYTLQFDETLPGDVDFSRSSINTSTTSRETDSDVIIVDEVE